MWDLKIKGGLENIFVSNDLCVDVKYMYFSFIDVMCEYFLKIFFQKYIV